VSDVYDPPEMCPRCMCCTTHVHDEDCPSCGGEGVVDAYDEDPLNADPGEVAHCGLCDGIGILEVSSCTCDSAGRHEP